MATKFEICQRAVNDAFTDKLHAAFSVKFKRELDTTFNLIDMQLVSRPADGEPFTPEQKAWVETYSHAYGDALEVVRGLAHAQLLKAA